VVSLTVQALEESRRVRISSVDSVRSNSPWVLRRLQSHVRMMDPVTPYLCVRAILGSRSPRVVVSSIRTEQMPALGIAMVTVSLCENIVVASNGQGNYGSDL
jgi:hypothetical protein